MMSADHGLSERTYSALKADLLHGRLPRGRLHVTALAARYGCSATPVREALLRLVGERLVEMSGAGGFSANPMSLANARDLYEVSREFAIATTRSIDWGAGNGIAAGRAVTDTAAELLCQLAARTGNDLVVAAVAAINDRMIGLGAAEERALGQQPQEIGSLVGHLQSGRSSDLRKGLRRYYGRRLRNLSRIISELNSTDASIAAASTTGT